MDDEDYINTVEDEIEGTQETFSCVNKIKNSQSLEEFDNFSHIDHDDIDMQVSARPRRLSEFKMTTKQLPIPPASSFFIFSSKNR